jgi:hypothetical protein
LTQYAKGSLTINGEHRVLPLGPDNRDVRTDVVRPQEVNVRETVLSALEDVDPVAVDVPVHRPLNIIDATVHLSLELSSSSEGPAPVLAPPVLEVLGNDGFATAFPHGKGSTSTYNWDPDDIRDFAEFI